MKNTKDGEKVTMSGMLKAAIVFIAWGMLSVFFSLFYNDSTAPIVSAVMIFALYLILPKSKKEEKMDDNPAPVIHEENEVVVQDERSPADKQILQTIEIVESTYASFGYTVHVSEVYLQDNAYALGLEICMGTKVDEIISLSNEIALATSSPTGKVDIHMVPGRNLIEIVVPHREKAISKGKYKIIKVFIDNKLESGKLQETEFYHDLKMFLRVILIKTGDLFYWLEKKVPRKPLY
jgi:DNA segregation ATPase FtsK/SpoIIIE-like protein